MKKIVMFSILIILIFGGAYYAVSTYEPSAPKKESTDNKSTENKDVITETTTDTTNRYNPEDMKVPAPDFTLADLKGNKVTLSELKGKNVFLNFWASWCPPCKAEMPDIEKLYQETKASDLVILAVNLGETKATTASFMSKNKYNFTALLDTDNTVASEYSVVSIPTSYFIDKEGFIRAGKVGAMTLEEMKYYVDLLSK